MIKNKKILFLLLLIPLGVNAATLNNPLQADSIPELIGDMVRGILGIVGSLALFYLVWGGIMWMTSGGNAEKVRKGRDAIVWAIFGLAIIFFSYSVLNFVFESIAPAS